MLQQLILKFQTITSQSQTSQPSIFIYKLVTSMCKSKKKLTNSVMEPNQKPKRSSSSSSTSKNSSKKSSFNNSHQNLISQTGSTTSFILNNFNNNNNNSNSWGASSSSNSTSHHSLTSLKGLLFPENVQSHIYNFSEIRLATSNFLKTPLSSSSTSTTWRCNIHGQETVVIQRKFRRKMDTSALVQHVALICRSHHSSLIPLKGVSVSGNYIYLVYEYIHGVNLSIALRNPRNPNFTVLSNWGTRIRIASDIACGLDYIHNSTGLALGLGFVHNHIKSTSVIVTEDSLNAKICHFGTAELCGEAPEPGQVEIGSGRKRSELKIEGTRGYMAPEFSSTGTATVMSDVYAFGVVILELVSGKEAVKYEVDEETGAFTRVSVIDTAAIAVADGGAGLRGWVDKRLRDSYPVDVAEKLVRLGLECVENDPNIRPDMGRVAGRISQMYLESQTWAKNFAPPTDFTVSLGPR